MLALFFLAERERELASTKIFFRKFCLATVSRPHSPFCVVRHRSDVQLLHTSQTIGSFFQLTTFAEREGVEPSIPCGIPPFQGGALGHYATSPFLTFTRFILLKISIEVNPTSTASIPHCAGVKFP